MPFNRQPDPPINEKLDAERDKHNGFGWREFDLFNDPAINVPVTVQKRLMGVGSTNTIYAWQKKRQELREGKQP